MAPRARNPPPHRPQTRRILTTAAGPPSLGGRANQFLTADEARKFLATANGHRLQTLFELALQEDLDLAGGTANIRRTLQRTNSGGLTPLPTKTKSSERRIALPTPCLRSLEQHRDRQLQETRGGEDGLTGQRLRLLPPQ
ncbi:hypothetical protein ACJ7VE_15430 [Streptomyces sp. PB17]|uniref:hypothetical protein n=1 Tax=Streptomyces sp. PB17 TaxID=3384158 RepID=UPI0038B4C06E